MSIADRTDAKNKRGVVGYNPLASQRSASSFHANKIPTADGDLGFDYSKPASEWFASSSGQDFLKNVLGQINPTPYRSVSGSGGMKASDALDLAKFRYQQQQDAADAARSARTLQAYQNMLSGGGYREGTDAILGMIGREGERSAGAVNKAYADALANIAAGYETAQGLTTQGYGALENYLRQNPNNPFADVQVSAGTAPDAMEQILSAYGVSADPVRAQVAAEQAAAQQGAAGFQNLLGTLGGVAQQSDLSRLAELEMARTLAGQTLGTQRATYSSQAEQARANALAQIEAQLAQSRLEQEMAAQARRQQIQDAIIAAGAEPTKQDDTKKKEEDQTKSPSGESEDERRRREMLAQMVANAAAGGGTGVNLGQMLPYAI
jgi:hypothetical protein